MFARREFPESIVMEYVFCLEYFAFLPETEVLCRCVLQVTNVWALDHNL